MRIAVVNTGESSIKLAAMDVGPDRVVEAGRTELDLPPGKAGAAALHEALAALPDSPDAFGHRYVHPGPAFSDPVTVTPEVEAALAAQLPLAPLHNAVALEAIREVGRAYPGVPRVAAFDTAFHAHRDAASMRYALPDALVREFQLRRYGFHGFAHASLVDSLAEATGASSGDITTVTLQLGAGCSACAVRRGRSIETSMGYTPLEGLVMATRSGSIDPAIVLRLVRAGFDADRIERELTQRSGLQALAGRADMRAILTDARDGSSAAGAAIDLFCRRIVLTVGAYLTLLAGDGSLVFGGGIGTHAAEIRERVAAGLSAWNIALDPARNAANEPGRISRAASRPVYMFRTNEEAVIAQLVARHLGQQRD